MNQALALEILLAGHSAMLTGPAGSGKTYVLNQFIKEAKKDGKSVAVTATTGLAATHLGGTTIHAWSGMGVHSEVPPKFLEHLSKTRRELIEKADVLVIDEISMLHDYRLDVIDEITRMVRKSDKPFGGIQIVLCGDFFQLPPVNRTEERQGSFVTNSHAWQQLDPVICYLEEQHRQDDQAFLEILNALRGGDIRRRHAEALLARMNAALDGEDITELHTTNINVDGINQAKLDAIAKDGYAFYMQTTGSQNYVDSLKRSCLALEELVLKEGAFVMCIKNSPEKRFVNGSLGIVIGFEELTNYPIVKLRSGKEITMYPETWELRDGTKKRASLTQIPLRLAWAITVHKSQGMTLDAARINLGRAFVEGMGYVALSRVRGLDTLALTGLNNRALKVSTEALQIDGHLRAKAEKAAKEYAPLLKNAKKRKKDAPKKANGGNSEWAAKIAIMRETYPRAFMPWRKDEDETIQRLFKEKVSLDKMSEVLERQPGGIIARLKKHFGDDVEIS